MEMMIAENIRMFRKQKSLTQEQLAEALGVTAGAVYKWEAKLSVPELSLIVEMADLFDISVDVLLGYEMKDNRLEATVQRLKEYGHDKNIAGLSEAEKALKKYPNAFTVVYQSATLYQVFGTESQKKEWSLRALELLEHARLLLSQNTDPEISELSIYGEMANMYLMLNEGEKAIELWKTNNAGGLYNDRIGLTLATNRNLPEEAMPFLSEALLHNITSLISTISGYINVYFKRGDFSSVQAIVLWGIALFSGLQKSEKTSFLDKINGVFYVCLAAAQMQAENMSEARISLEKAKALAQSFDAAPDYDVRSIRFMDNPARACIHDSLGTTAMESLENTIHFLENERVSHMWKEILEHAE